MTATRPRGHRLILVRDLTSTHLGRQVDVRGLVGRLDGVIPCGDRVQLVLNVGGLRAETAALPAGEAVDVWREVAS